MLIDLPTEFCLKLYHITSHSVLQQRRSYAGQSLRSVFYIYDADGAVGGMAKAPTLRPVDCSVLRALTILHHPISVYRNAKFLTRIDPENVPQFACLFSQGN